MPSLHIVKPKKNSPGKLSAKPTSQMKSGQRDRERDSLKKLRNVAAKKRRKEALKRLGVTETQLRDIPDISSLLKQGTGGLTATLAALRFSPMPSAVSFVDQYDATPSRDRDSLPWEALLIKAEVDVSSFLGAAILAIQSYSANAVKIIALSAHPDIIKARVERAKMLGGQSDATAIDQALGFLPTAKGSTFIINPVGGKKEIGPGDDDDGPEAPEGDMDHLFPDLIETQRTLIPAKTKMLESGPQ